MRQSLQVHFSGWKPKVTNGGIQMEVDNWIYTF